MFVFPDVGKGLRAIRNENIVTVEKNDDIAFARRKTGVDGRALAAVFFQDRRDFILIRGDNFPRVIRASIVHADDLDVGITLGESAVDGLGEEPPIIEA